MQLVVKDVHKARAQLVERGVEVSEVQVLGENPNPDGDPLDNVGFVFFSDPEPPPDPAWFKCSFCRKTNRRVLFGAEYPVRDPNTFAVIALVSICNECVAMFAERLAQGSLEGPPPH